MAGFEDDPNPEERQTVYLKIDFTIFKKKYQYIQC